MNRTPPPARCLHTAIDSQGWWGLSEWKQGEHSTGLATLTLLRRRYLGPDQAAVDYGRSRAHRSRQVHQAPSSPRKKSARPIAAAVSLTRGYARRPPVRAAGRPVGRPGRTLCRRGDRAGAGSGDPHSLRWRRTGLPTGPRRHSQRETAAARPRSPRVEKQAGSGPRGRPTQPASCS